MLFCLAQEELSEWVRKVEGISREEMTSGSQILVHLHCEVARLFVWDRSCERFVSWQKCCLFGEGAEANLGINNYRDLFYFLVKTGSGHDIFFLLIWCLPLSSCLPAKSRIQ